MVKEFIYDVVRSPLITEKTSEADNGTKKGMMRDDNIP